MKIVNLLLLTVLLSFVHCDSQSLKNSGYSDLNELFQDFPKILKSKEWKDIETYVKKITPDEGTLDYMKENKLSYRGLPQVQEKMPMAINYIHASYLASVARFRASLEQKGDLEALTFVKVERESTEIVDRELGTEKKLGIEATETFIILKSGDKEYRCKLGEMFKINGKWKSFTEPKLGW